MPLGKSVHRPPGGGGHCGPGDRFVVAVRSRTDVAIARKRDAIDLWVPVTVALLAHWTTSNPPPQRSSPGDDCAAARSFGIGLLGLEDDLGPTVSAVVEVLVGVRGFAEGNLVGNDP